MFKKLFNKINNQPIEKYWGIILVEAVVIGGIGLLAWTPVITIPYLAAAVGVGWYLKRDIKKVVLAERKQHVRLLTGRK